MASLPAEARKGPAACETERIAVSDNGVRYRAREIAAAREVVVMERLARSLITEIVLHDLSLILGLQSAS